MQWSWWKTENSDMFERRECPTMKPCPTLFKIMQVSSSLFLVLKWSGSQANCLRGRFSAQARFESLEGALEYEALKWNALISVPAGSWEILRLGSREMMKLLSLNLSFQKHEREGTLTNQSLISLERSASSEACNGWSNTEENSQQNLRQGPRIKSWGLRVHRGVWKVLTLEHRVSFSIRFAP